MLGIGFVISDKENEKRRALLPSNIRNFSKSRYLFFESGYGDALGYSDEEYLRAGARIVNREEALAQPIICDPKIGDAGYLGKLRRGQVVFGWIHAVQNKEIADALLKSRVTAIAWEDMFSDGRHVFWRNNELAGEAAILHAFTLFGKMPYECKVALIGRGNIARGAFRILAGLGAEVVVYDRKTEELLRKELERYDVVVNAVLWDTQRTDHIIYRSHLSKLKRPSMIIDISCDRAGAIETSVPTSISSPVYEVDGVLHYVVDHTPALVSHSASRVIGDAILPYLGTLISGSYKECDVLNRAIIIEDGRIIDRRIIEFQKRHIGPID